MEITYDAAKRSFIVSRPSRPIHQLAKELRLRPRQDGSVRMPDLVRVRQTLEAEAGPLSGSTGKQAPVRCVAPALIRDDQKQHVAYHLARGQSSGVAAMLCNQVCCGKTLEAISVLATLRPKRALIICPLGVLGTWRAELKKWLSSALTATERKDVWSTTWGGAVALRHYEAMQARCHDIPPTDLLIVDEAHRCTNRSKYTKGTEAAIKKGRVPLAERVLTQAETIATAARKSKHRVLMTGTEARNMLEDVWGLLRLLDPDRYSSFWTFAFCYFNVIENRFGMEIGPLLKEWEDAFQLEVGQWQTRSTRAEIFPELGFEAQLVPIDLDEEDQATMDEKFWGPWWKYHLSPLAAITWARQFAIWPDLAEPTDHIHLRGKLAYTIDRLRDLDCQAVVCSDFTTPLTVIEEELPAGETCKIVGGMSDKQRVEAREGFEGGEYRVCLIHPQAGGEGIDLSVADRLIFLSLPWDL